MHTTAFGHDMNEAQQPGATEYVVAAPDASEYIVREAHVEADGIDWCAWWAEYAEGLD